MSNPVELPFAETIVFGQFSLFPAARLLKFEGSPLLLGSRAMDILTILVERPGTVVSKKELIARVWPDMTVDESGLRFHIAALRKILKDNQNGNRYVANVPGRGYCFVAPVARGGKAQPERAAARTDKTALPHGLPPGLMRMVGRDETVRDLSERLAEHRFITITGAGGMGKTTVAVSVAHELASTFGNAVWFVDLSEINNPNLVPKLLATAFGMTAPTTDLLPRLSAFLKDKRLLLVLDNCEHVVGVVASLAERLLKSAPGLHILASSREALRADGEQVYRLQPLSSPPPDLPLSAAEALTYPAVQLFIERAAASGTHITLSDAEAYIVCGICSHLDGIPLAIDVAAGRVDAHGLTGTADLLNHPSCWLYWQGPRTSHSRHRTLHALLDWSYNLLTDNERSILRRLSVFASTFTLEAACAVAADTEIGIEMIVDVICGLVAKSLVSTVVDACTVTYRLPEMTKAFAFEKLAQNSEVDSVTRKHADYFSHVLRQRDDDRVVRGMGRHRGRQTLHLVNA